jgi:ankyrin repeat protein
MEPIMKKLLYCVLTLLSFAQNLEVQAAAKESSPTKDGSLAKQLQVFPGGHKLRLDRKHESNPNAVQFGVTLLVDRIYRKDEAECIKILSDPLIDVDKQSDFTYTYENGTSKVIPITPLVAALYMDMNKVFEKLLEQGADPNMTFDRKLTPLMLIVDKLAKSRNEKQFLKNYNLFKLLIADERTDLNLQEKKGFTAFHAFCSKNFQIYDCYKDNAIKVINELLANGANPTIPRENTLVSPVMTAAKINPFIVRHLLQENPSLKDQQDSLGKNVLHHAFFASEIDVNFIDYLIGLFPDYHGISTLLFIINNHPDSSAILSPDLIRTLRINRTELFSINTIPEPVQILEVLLLLQSGTEMAINQENIEYFLDTQQPPNSRSHSMFGTALHIAAKTNKSNAAELLMQKGFSANAKATEDLVTPLMVALKHKCRKTVNCLLEQTNLQLTDKNGDTALAYAAKFYDEEILNSVLEFYQKHYPHYIQIENNEGKTAYDLLPDEVKKTNQNARELIATERNQQQDLSHEEKKARIIANLERAKKEIAFQEFIAEKSAIEETENEASNPPAETTPDLKTKIRLRLTNALKKFHILSGKSDPKTMKMRHFFLERQGYFSDSSKESAHDRKARAKFYEQLRTTMSDEEAQETIINNHAFPRSAIQALLDSVTDERTGITVKASYTTDKGEMCEGDYEVFFVKMSDGIVQVYHSLFKQKSIKKVPSKKIPAATKDAHADAASASAAAADDDFTKVGAFTSEKTELSDKFIHTITDNNTGTVYTLEIPK